MNALTTDVNVNAISVGAYAVDTIALAPKWEVTGGVRVDRFDASLSQPLPLNSPNLERVDVMPSWRTALVFKPASNGSIYFAYGTSFNPSAETLALSASTAAVAPEENKTIEVGSKWDLFSRRLSLRTSVFRTTKENARETDPTNALLTVLAGTQRVNGFQVQANGYLTSRWEVSDQLRLPGWQRSRVKILPPCSRRATGERTQEHFQRLEHLRPSLAPGRRRRSRFRGQPDRQFHRAA